MKRVAGASANSADDVGVVGAYQAAVARRLGAARALLVRADAASALVASLAGNGGALVAEALGGTPVGVADIHALSLRVGAGTLLVVDVTNATTHGCAAVRLGADVAFSKAGDGVYVVGVSRAAAAGLGPRLARLPMASDAVGAAVAAADRSVAARWHATSDAAAVIANYLRCHPRVAAVRYPGLKDDPSFGLAARTLTGGFGATLSYATVGRAQTWRNVSATTADPRTQVMALERALSSRGA